MTVAGAQNKIVARISRWEGVDAEPHRFGGTEFRVGRSELGHVHGDHLADIAFPMDVRNRLIAEGRAEPHRDDRGGGRVEEFAARLEKPGALFSVQRSQIGTLVGN